MGLRTLLFSLSSGSALAFLAGTRCPHARTAVSMSAYGETSRVVVLGGGFGGLYSALRLAQLAEPSSRPAFDVTLVDRSDRFVFLPLLYELAVGDATEDEVTPTFSSLLAGTGITMVRAEVENIDVNSRRVRLKPSSNDSVVGPTELQFDRLIVALGSEPALGKVPGAEEHAMTFHRREDAMMLHERLREAESLKGRSMLRVVVIGGGYSGVEIATNLASRLGKDRFSVTLVNRGLQILSTAPAHNRAAANKRLTEEGVEVLLGMDVVSVGADRVVLTEGQGLGTVSGETAGTETVVAADLVIWTAGAGVSEVIKETGLQTDGRGRIVTDSFLRSVDEPDVYVLGDSAAIQGKTDVPATAQVAFQQADVAAYNLWSSLTGKSRPLPFSYLPLGEMLTLGPLDGAVSGLQGLLQLEGKAASLARRLVYIARMPTSKQRITAARSWFKSRVERVREAVAAIGAE